MYLRASRLVAEMAAVVLLSGLVIAGLNRLDATTPARPRTPYLEAARQAAAWIRSTSISQPPGRVDWPADPRDPTSVGPTLYSGTPGIVLFYVQLAESTGDRRYLRDARGGAETLLLTAGREKRAGLWEGLSGVGTALLAVAQATGDPRYVEGARQVTRALARTAVRRGSGVEWNDATDIISGSAGTGLFLLSAARELEDRSLRDLAVAAGDRLLERARPEGPGLKWPMDSQFPRLMPNFSHGTAGVAYFLATLYQETRESRFLDAALAGARYLQSIASTEGDVCLIFHDEPTGKSLYYLGWCHGPVGTARLFYRLYVVTGDRAWLDWTRRAARALTTSGIPEKSTPGYWNNVGQCCGAAGVVDFFLDWHRVTKDPADLVFAKRVADDLLRRGTRGPDGLKWVQAENRTQPANLAAQTGLMQGAAGIGLALLHLDAVERGRPFRMLLPDSPFSRP